MWLCVCVFVIFSFSFIQLNCRPLVLIFTIHYSNDTTIVILNENKNNKRDRTMAINDLKNWEFWCVLLIFIFLAFYWINAVCMKCSSLSSLKMIIVITSIILPHTSCRSLWWYNRSNDLKKKKNGQIVNDTNKHCLFQFWFWFEFSICFHFKFSFELQSFFIFTFVRINGNIDKHLNQSSFEQCFIIVFINRWHFQFGGSSKAKINIFFSFVRSFVAAQYFQNVIFHFRFSFSLSFSIAFIHLVLCVFVIRFWVFEVAIERAMKTCTMLIFRWTLRWIHMSLFFFSGSNSSRIILSTI